jgi:hypothetical protein
MEWPIASCHGVVRWLLHGGEDAHDYVILGWIAAPDLIASSSETMTFVN